jgi:trans-aconitate 2-methyltransferase
MWSPERYLRYESERARPFFELVAAIDHPGPRRVADLGCGPGGLTATLLSRWPGAVIWGVDTSEEMVAHAGRRAVVDRLRFVRADVGLWSPPEPVDVMISNACFHWVPDHRRLFDHLLPHLEAGGVLAFQVPNNFEEPSHRTVWQVAEAGPWSERLRDVHRGAVETPRWYIAELSERGLSVNAWESTYYHVLTGEHPVVEWLEGTTLRPILAALEEGERDAFLESCSKRLAEAYPPRPFGTVFPFRRIFVVAKRSR